MLKVATRRATQSANSYADVGYVDAYHTLHIDDRWEALALEEKEAGLIKASSYINGHYDFIGRVKSQSQSLLWPRIDAVDSEGRLHDGIPEPIKQATCELALESALSGLDNPLTDENFIASRSSGVAGIDNKVDYSASKPAGPVFPKIDSLLKSLIEQKSNVCVFKLGA